MSNLDALREQVLALPVVDRERLMEDIMTSLNPESREAIDKAWVAEALDRIEAYDRGDMKSYSVEEIEKSLEL